MENFGNGDLQNFHLHEVEFVVYYNHKIMNDHPREEFMREAIRLAKLGQAEGDYAVGAVVVQNGKIIVAQNSRSKRDESPIAHAETLAIVETSKKLDRRHLADCVLYSTHEPCPMCTGTAVFARLQGIVYGTRINDMKEHREKYANGNFLWRTIEIPCEEIIKKSTEDIFIVKEFLRDECLRLFHS